ncbi:MAG: SDR family oxidoreductase [Bacteroidota bacterium]|nr:SDR family oxidoreductase [Bacteroidota bacterium]
MKILLFGATGNLGKEIAKEIVGRGFDLTIVVRNETKAKQMSDITSKYVIADVCNKSTLDNIFDDQEMVISALGKSVSPNDKSKPTFKEVDYNANENILNEAKKAGVKKFIYVSAFHSEKYLHLEYFKVHHDFSELLKKSGLDYTIIKPPAIFSAFIDMIDMAKKGQLVNIGKGDKKTNPIYEGDLAKITVEAINLQNSIIEAGGKKIYTRKQLNEIVQNEINSQKKIRTVPMSLFKMTLPIIKLFSKNTYDKFVFFIEVMQHDTIAPQQGEMTFEEYVRMKK